MKARHHFLGVLIVVYLIGSAYAVTETDYLAILLEGQKIGSNIHERAVENGIVTTTETLSMTLGRGGQAVTVLSKEVHTETIMGKPLGIELTMTTSGVEQKIVGKIQDGKILIQRQVMGQTVEVTQAWPADALLNEGLLRLQKERGLVAGDSFDVKLFRPDMMTTVVATIDVGHKKKVPLLFGVQEELTEVKTTMKVQSEQIVMTSYVDDDLNAKKTTVPMMGMMLEMMACDEAFAKQEDAIIDFLEKLSIASPVKLTNLSKIESITYTIKPTESATFSIPVSSTQSVKVEGDTTYLTVHRIKPPADVNFPYIGDDPALQLALTSNDYIQSDDAKVIDLAKTAVGGTQDAATAAGRIEAFVDGYINIKDLSVGYASAAEVAQNRQGDCSEHAVLATAMCRAVGIPARVVCGVVYADSFLSKQSIFGGHMWTEVYIGDRWYGLDATRSEQRIGPGHIALVYGNGEPTDFFGLVNTLGCFKIDKITINERVQASETTDKPQ